ncbi:diguanylate cyclase [Herbaspirillum sp. RTI4]|uniref:diguanylate cyclase domain-containing protein n=1 Tax=Herbaspirillum sp. RTI4 TaxID=3048640 RepID=UPI002AB36DB2|nr:diguanylate cyclase [Herbaspirillum sp. RTI4]MDY7578950.1 diguanylate cyclase [Herbaspirillum sp. RTI4]MEA9980881.1 diguanylate cyclase [Herbaspirillum sp. RTI4]
MKTNKMPAPIAAALAGLDPAILAEFARLNKIIHSLMDRAERVGTMQKSDFDLFQKAARLEDQIRHRTQELEQTLVKNKEISEALQKSSERFQRLTNLSSDWHWEQDEHFRFTLVQSSAQINGRVHSHEYLGKTRWELDIGMAPSEWSEHKAQMERHESFADLEYKLQVENNPDQWFSVSGEPVFDSTGQFTGYFGSGKYITERKKAELLRTGQSRVLEMIATSMPLGSTLESLMHLLESQLDGMMASILLLDDDGLHLRHGAGPSLPLKYLQAIDGLAVGPNSGVCGTAIYRNERVIVSDILADPLLADYRELAIEHGLRSCCSTPITTHHGKLLGTFALYSAEVHTPTAQEEQLIDVATRIASIAIVRRNNEARISHMAHHDALTGLPNRLLLEDRLKQAMLHADRYGRKVVVAFIDLDKFKSINDSLGHSTGDDLLKVMADRMQRCVRATDTVVRLGGDEFVIILFDQPGQKAAISPLLTKISDAITAPIRLAQQWLEVTSSIGIAVYPDDGTDTGTLIMNADMAMYSAKDQGRNNCQFYTPDLKAKMHAKLMLENANPKGER